MILFTDLDGTLLTDSKELTKENQDAIREAIKAGHKVVISTGRPLAGATAQAHARCRVCAAWISRKRMAARTTGWNGRRTTATRKRFFPPPWGTRS